MSKKESRGAKQLAGILETLSGSIDNLVITKKGVIYFKQPKSKRSKSSS